MIRRARRLTIFVLAAAGMFLVVLEGRLFYLQLMPPSGPLPLPYRLHRVVEQGVRGPILDRRGGTIAETLTCYDLFAWAPEIRAAGTVHEVAHQLAMLTACSSQELEEKLQTQDWPLLARRILDLSVVEAVQDLMRTPSYRPLHLEPRYERVYSPTALHFSPLVGYVDGQEHEGTAGLEQEFHRWLAPTSGWRSEYRDNRQRPWLELDAPGDPARFGGSIHLTLDPLLQELALQAVDEIVGEFGGNWAQAIVMDPRGGELLAMAQWPRPAQAGRPRTSAEVSSLAQRTLATQEMYTPGSTFKPLMMGQLLDHAKVTPGELVPCHSGVFYFGGRRLKDIRGGHEELTPTEILIHSSNIGIAQLVLRMLPLERPAKGDPAFGVYQDYLSAMGFGAVALGLPGEQKGLVPRLADFTWNYTAVSLAMGHEIAVTSVQMASAAAAVINGGIWREPRLVRGLESADGRWLDPPPAERRVLAPSSSRALRHMLMQVADEGTFAQHRPVGYSVGAKTGTPEKDHDRSKITPSCWAFAPADEPEVLVLMVLDEPGHGRYSSQIVAPSTLRLLGEVLRRRRVVPDRQDERELARTPSLAVLSR